jgi:hypothetical protein
MPEPNEAVETKETPAGGKPAESAEPKPTNSSDELLRLQRENATLATRLKEAGDVQAKLDTLTQQVDDDKKAQLEKQGKYEDLYKTEQSTTKQLNARIAEMERWENFRGAVAKADKLEYPATTVIEMAKHVDTQTGGELEHDDLIAKTVEGVYRQAGDDGHRRWVGKWWAVRCHGRRGAACRASQESSGR